MWQLPAMIVGTTVVLSIPIGFYLAWIADGRYRAPDGCAGSSNSSTPARRTGSSMPARCWL